MMNFAPMLLEWDSSKLREVEDAKVIYRQAKAEGRRIEDLIGNPVEFFKPSLHGIRILAKELKDSQFRMRILNEKGDETLIWDSLDSAEVKESAKIFKEYLDKGWRAFAISSDGKIKKRLHSFDAELEEVVFEENKYREKLNNFVKKFTEIKLLPRTFPG